MPRGRKKTVGQRLGLLTGFGLILGGAAGWAWSLFQAPGQAATPPVATPQPPPAHDVPVEPGTTGGAPAAAAVQAQPELADEDGPDEDVADAPVSSEQPGGVEGEHETSVVEEPAPDDEQTMALDETDPVEETFAAASSDLPEADEVADTDEEDDDDPVPGNVRTVARTQTDEVESAPPAAVSPPATSVPDAVKAIRAAAAAARERLEKSAGALPSPAAPVDTQD